MDRAQGFPFGAGLCLGNRNGRSRQAYIVAFIANDSKIGFGFVQHWTILVALRLILGILEAGFFPGCVFLISTWYSRYDTQKRYAVFYLMGTIASGLGGVLAYGLQQMVSRNAAFLERCPVLTHSTAWLCRHRGLEMDIHHRGCGHLPDRRRRLRFRCRLSGPRHQ